MKSTLAEPNPKWLSSGGEGISHSDGSPAPVIEKSALEFDCPCGCGDRIVVPLLPGFGGSHWTKTGDDFNTLSLTPSIQRTTGCKTHMVITDGRITP